MEYMSMAQAVGEEQFSEGIVWTPEEIDEWFAGDTQAASEHFELDYDDALNRAMAEVDRLRSQKSKYVEYVDGWE